MKKKAKSAPKAKAKAKPRAKIKAKPRAKAKAKPTVASKWVKLVEKHGIMLAAAHGPILNIAQAVAGEPIVGGWWAHPKGKAIFAALSEIDDSHDVRCFKLIDGKVTFVHRRMWPALVRLGNAGAVATDLLGSVQQEHLPTGEHRNSIVPFPDWVDDATATAASKLDVDAARALVPFL